MTDEGLELLVRGATLALISSASDRKAQALGTGFFLTPDLVATCAHVVAKASPLSINTIHAISLQTDQTFTLGTAPDSYAPASADIDLAILKVTGSSNPVPMPYVLLSTSLAIGDEMWTYGYPSGQFRGGQSATFRYQGPSRLDSAVTDLLRVWGTPVRAGASGSPVLNRRTGAICGMLCLSDSAGSAHLVPAETILQQCADARAVLEAGATAHKQWLAQLTDTQLEAGKWSYPRRSLRAYFQAAERAARRHPYAIYIARRQGTTESPTLPPLSSVYVYQTVSRRATRKRQRHLPNLHVIAADRIFDRPEDSLLIGEAGSGKSSLFRAATWQSLDRWARDEMDQTVPVRVRAADLLQPGPLPEAIATSVNNDLGEVGTATRWQPEFFQSFPLPNVPWLVLIDALDEVLDSRQRAAIIEKVVGFRSQLIERTHQFVIATRPLANDNFFAGSGFAVYRLLPFTDRQFRDFAIHWFRFLGVGDARTEATQLLSQVLSAAMGDLFRLPLVAAMLCQLHAHQKDRPTPSTAVDVYRRFIDFSYLRFFESGIRSDLENSVREYGDRAVAAIDQLVTEAVLLVRKLAWRSRQETLDAAKSIQAWTAPFKPAHLPDTKWFELIVDTLRRTGLLIESTGRFEFAHHSIGEFLAAEFVGDDPALTQRVFEEILPSKQGDWQAARSFWQHPYARFVVLLWHRQFGIDSALERVVTHGGLEGCQYIATLAAEGLVLSKALVANTSSRLRAFADAAPDGLTRRTAIQAALSLSEATGSSMLVELAGNGAASAEDRRWALERLAALLDPRVAAERRAGATEGLMPDHRWALTVLASRPADHGRELLVRLAGDTSLEGVDRRWAAEALAETGDRRAIDLLSQLSSDEALQVADREFAAETLSTRFDIAATTGARVRRRLARFGLPWQPPAISEILEPLIAIHRATHPKADVGLLQRAYDVANRWHSGQFRLSGDPYIVHPLAVAGILANLGMDTITLVAALLHDLIEDTEYTLEELRNEFGAEVALLVDGVTRLDPIKLGDAAKAETIRKMVIATAKDPRVLVLKLASRLHNMRTLTFLPRVKQEEVARDTIEILSPLAHRLGMNTIRWELEDLAFAALYPKRYEEIRRLVNERAEELDAYVSQVRQKIASDLRTAKIEAEVTGRPKHLYSIYQKMIARDLDFGEIYDLVGVRILVDTVRDCYAALGVIHSTWQPVPDRFKDYIVMPKFNAYQSLHTMVIGPNGKPIEMQIRTYAMHRTAEYGIAAHWRFGETKNATIDPPGHIDEMTWLRQLLDWQREASDPTEFLDALRFDLSTQEVYVFTPRGDVIALPKDSTPVDFAYAVHTDMGHKCIGAKVNGKVVPLESKLSNGDVIEIYESKSRTAGPSQEWLGFVQSARARTKIRQFPIARRREGSMEDGI